VPIYPACSGEVIVAIERYMFFPSLMESDRETQKNCIYNYNNDGLVKSWFMPQAAAYEKRTQSRAINI